MAVLHKCSTLLEYMYTQLDNSISVQYLHLALKLVVSFETKFSHFYYNSYDDDNLLNVGNQIQLLESPFRSAAQIKSSFSSTESVSDQPGNTPKSASDYGSYAYSERGRPAKQSFRQRIQRCASN